MPLNWGACAILSSGALPFHRHLPHKQLSNKGKRCLVKDRSAHYGSIQAAANTESLLNQPNPLFGDRRRADENVKGDGFLKRSEKIPPRYWSN
jgi:hypothetical protein